MRKTLILLVSLIVPAVSFGAGKNIGYTDNHQDEQSQDDTDNSNQPQKNNRKENVRDRGRQQAKDIRAPRPPRQFMHGGSMASTSAAAPIIINNNNVNTNNNVVQTQQAQQQTQQQTTTVAVAEPVEVVHTAPARSVVVTQAREPSYTSTRNGYWDEGGYFGLGFRIGAGNMKESDSSFSNTYNPAGASFDMSFGYKVPFFRVGGELGFSGFATDVTAPSGWQKESDSYSAFTIMPQVFLDIDTPSRIAPYIGFGGGLGVVSAKYTLTDWYGSDTNYSATKANLVYAVMAGVHIGLIPQMELNIGYRFQDYGNVDLLGYSNKLYAHEVNLGLVFKF